MQGSGKKPLLSKYVSVTHHQDRKNELEYCFSREKEIVLEQQKQRVPMSIYDFVKMTIWLCLICFSTYAKVQEACKKMMQENASLKVPHDSVYTQQVKNLLEIALSCTISNMFLHFM